MSGWRKIKNSVKNIGHLPHVNIFVVALLLVIFFLIIEVFARAQNLYILWPSVDIVTHFCGGLAIGSVVLWFYSLSKNINKKLMVIIWVFLISLLWEVIEMAEEAIFPETIPELRDYFIWDGFFDIIMALVGAGTVFAIFSYLKRKTKIFGKIKSLE